MATPSPLASPPAPSRESTPAPDPSADWANQRDLILRIMGPTPTLIGVCLAGVSLFVVHPRLSLTPTALDDFLALAALLFMLSIYLTVWAVRMPNQARALALSRWVIRIFMTAMTILVCMGMLMLFAVS